jgi:hypothetical protein
MKLVEEKEGRPLEREGAKFLVFLIIRMCGVASRFLDNRLGVKSVRKILGGLAFAF